MNEARHGAWGVIREIGLECDTVRQQEGSLKLNWPVFAERVGNDGLLIVDELDVHNGVPFSFRCRTLVVSNDTKVLYDSLENGIDDGYGCNVDDVHFAMLRRTCWDILIVKHSGETVSRIDLANVSKRIPRLLSFTNDRTFLLAFFSKSHEIDLVEVDLEGRVTWYLPRAPGPIGVPGSMQLLESGNILVADEFRHVVHEVQRNGSVSCRWGKWADPSSGPQHLSNPKTAWQLNDGTLLIADSNNHRVIRVKPAGDDFDPVLCDRDLICPSFIREDGVNGYIVCDAANQCVLSVDDTGAMQVIVGEPIVRKRWLSFPRSVEYLGDDRYLIADTAKNRLLLANHNDWQEIKVINDTPLFWPRAARMTTSGTVVIADGRNSRVIELSTDGELLRELKEIELAGKIFTLADPHDLRLLDDGELLVTDSALNIVFKASWRGSVSWVIGTDEEELNDPHSAQLIADGRLMIADSGNHRILFVDPAARRARTELSVVRSEEFVFRFHYPRYAEMSDDGTLAVVDSGNNRILLSDLNGAMRGEIASAVGSSISSFQYPRWAHVLNRHEVVVTDHFHHRIVHLRNRS